MVIKMVKNKTSVKISIGVCIALAVILLALAAFGPAIFELYMTAYRGFSATGKALIMLKKVFGLCFYPSSVFAAVILHSLLKLLFNIKNEKIFIPQNANCLRTVSWCCFAIAVITFVGGFFYMPFMFVAAAGGFTGMLLRVLKNVMQSAVELREENDLTI